MERVTAMSDKNSTLVTGKRFSDYFHQKSRNLDKLEQERNIPGDIVGATGDYMQRNRIQPLLLGSMIFDSS